MEKTNLLTKYRKNTGKWTGNFLDTLYDVIDSTILLADKLKS